MARLWRLAFVLSCLVVVAGCTAWTVDGTAWSARRVGDILEGRRSDGTEVRLYADRVRATAPSSQGGPVHVGHRATRTENAGLWLTVVGAGLSIVGGGLTLALFESGTGCPSFNACPVRTDAIITGSVVSGTGSVMGALVGPLIWTLGYLLAPSEAH